MNEVKDICAAMLDEPQPPLRAGSDVYSVVRGADRRRAARRLTGGGVALAGVAAVALAASGLGAGPPVGADDSPARDPGARAAPGEAAPREAVPRMVAATRTELPDLPSGDEVAAHGNQIYAILSAAVPSGFSAERRWGSAQTPPAWFLSDRRISIGPGGPDRSTMPYAVLADLVIGANGTEGSLAAMVVSDRMPAPTTDLCSAPVNERMDKVHGPAEICQVITVDGVPMRVTTHHGPEEGEVVNATWFVRNGFVTVSSRQGLVAYERPTDLPPDAAPDAGPVREHRPPLELPLFTADQLARVAANPDLLP